MTDIDITEATRLAAEAVDAATLALTPHGYVLATVERDDIATAAVTAALPALAEQFAALIEAARHPHGYHRVGMAPEDAAEWCALCDRMTHAARLVREAAEVTG